MAGAEAAYYNVLINLNGMEGDEEWAQEIRARAVAALADAESAAARLRELVRGRLER